MGTRYQHLSAEERATIMIMLQQGCSARSIARTLQRSPSTITREIRRALDWPQRAAFVPAGSSTYDARAAGARAHVMRLKRRRHPKLAEDGVLFGVVHHFLLQGWSPSQIAGTLKRMWPDDLDRRVSHETIYNCIYAMPRGELRKELIACLRRAQAKRMPRSRGQDRRGQLPEAVSIHLRPPEANERAFPGHWEGDLLKGAANRSAVGVLVERSSRLVMLAKLKDATAASALEGFTAKLRSIAEPMRKTLTYDRGKEMARHPELTEATGIRVYFCDPRSPWQRGSYENRLRFHQNINGLLRQYLPKGTDLSVYSQEELDAIADRLNNRPRAIHGFYPPIAVYQAMLEKLTQASHSLQ